MGDNVGDDRAEVVGLEERREARQALEAMRSLPHRRSFDRVCQELERLPEGMRVSEGLLLAWSLIADAAFAASGRAAGGRSEGLLSLAEALEREMDLINGEVRARLP